MSKENQHELQFEAGMPKEEIDVPLDFTKNQSGDDILEVRKIEVEEKEKERKEKRYFSAFRLIVGCLIFLGCIYVIEVLDSAIIKKDLTSVTSEIIEIVKTLLFTLSGYLFARKDNGD